MNKLLFLTLLFSVSIFAQNKTEVKTLTLQVDGFRSTEGKMLYAVFNSKDAFPKKHQKAVHKGILSIDKNGSVLTEIELPVGEYAITVVHDEDNNQKLKTNFIGMPVEGVGLSNNPKGMPNYNKSKFRLEADKKITIDMWYLGRKSKSKGK